MSKKIGLLKATTEFRGSFTDLRMPTHGVLAVTYSSSNANQPTNITELRLDNLDDVKAVQVALIKLRRKMIAHEKKKQAQV